MSTDRCKVKVTSINEEQDGHTIQLEVVTGESKENDKVFSHPGGHLILSIVRPEVAKRYELEKEFYLELTPIK